MKAPKGLIKALAVLIAVGGVGYFTYIRALPYFKPEEAAVPENTTKKGERKKQTIPIEASYSFRGPLIMRVTAQGTIKPFKEVPLITRTSGDVIAVNVYEGKRIRKGSLIAALDSADAVLSYKQSESELNEKRIKYLVGGNANTNGGSSNLDGTGGSQYETFIQKALNEWKDADTLLKSGKITRDQYTIRQRNYNVARAWSEGDRDKIAASTNGLIAAEIDFERKELELKNTRIYAPIDGVIANLDIQEGRQIGSGTEIGKVIDISRVRIEAGVLESEIADIAVGKNAYIRLSAYPNQRFQGKVETISPVVEDKTNKVTIIINNPEGKLKPGMFAFVEIDGKIYEDRFLVPKDAILERDQKDLVFTIRNGRAMWEYITRGLENGQFVEIAAFKDKFEPGELVAVGGHFTIAHDTPVRILNNPQKPDPNK